MHNFVVSTWVNLSEGCPMSCSVSGSNMAQLCLGAVDGAFELCFDADTMRVLAEKATTAVAEMDALFEREEAERIAAEQKAAEQDAREQVRSGLVAAECDAPGRHRLVTP
jgi:hypothetical protein